MGGGFLHADGASPSGVSAEPNLGLGVWLLPDRVVGKSAPKLGLGVGPDTLFRPNTPENDPTEAETIRNEK